MPIARKPPPNAAAQGKKPSQNEAYFLRRERTPDDPDVLSNRRFHAMNKWPDEPTCRASARNMLAYMSTLEALCRKLVRLYALALDLPETFFDACFAEPHMILRMSRYPVIDGADDTVASLVPHTNSGFMTLAAAQQGAGPVDQLLPDGRWMEAPGVDGRLRGQRRRHPAPLDQRALPVDAAPRAQRLGPAALRRAVLLRSQPRHHDRVPADLPVGRAIRPKYPPIKFGDYALWFAAQRYEHMAKVQAPSEADIAPGARATSRWQS